MDDEDKLKDIIVANSYIVIQRHGYFKLHQLLDNSNVMLGKDKVDLRNVIGKPFWTMFKMVPVKNKNREFSLEICSKGDSSSEILKAVSYGTDNRNIVDDGKSQLLSSEDINGMRESGLTGQKILEKLIENSTTFKEKTEYSQEKYLKKKGKKYFEYIIIRQPTLRLLSDIFYSRDQTKVMGLRHDTLAQLLTSINLQPDGVYALFENGSQALVGAGILSYLCSNGLLINLSVGNNPQKQAILSMNFKSEQLARLVNVKLKELFRFLEADAPGESLNIQMKSKEIKNLNLELNSNSNSPPKDITIGSTKTSDSCNVLSNEDVSLVKDSLNIISEANDKNSHCDSIEKSKSAAEISDGFSFVNNKEPSLMTDPSNDSAESLGSNCESSDLKKSSVKRKLSCEDSNNSKKPKWAEDLEKAVDAFKNRKLNGIVILAKEYPLNLIIKLLPFLKPSCQLVVYCVFREPLVQLFLELKKRRDVIGLHLTENWLRMYQVLPDRTHPDVTMSFSGHLLTATKVLVE